MEKSGGSLSTCLRIWNKTQKNELEELWWLPLGGLSQG